jgi:L-2-hydroxyglutarate oxidase LhgO
VINCAGLYGDTVEQIRLQQENSMKSAFVIQPRVGQFSVYASSSSSLPLKSIILPIPTKFSKGIIVYPNLFDQLIVGPTAETQEDRTQAPIKSDVKDILHKKLIEIIPICSKADYKYIGSYTGIRPATEYSDYQIQTYENVQWICCGGIRSTGLTSSLAIGEYICEQLKAMPVINSQLDCQGFSTERYNHSLEQLRSIFSLTNNGLQMNIVPQRDQTTSFPMTGSIQLGEHINLANLQIKCADELFNISHSLLKLALTSNDQF